MGKAQKKTGKGRIDKYYKLAKEQGFRARSAFKLIQLNKKYGFLEHARCCIDLCAAPGGWLQVASKYMPVNSLIIGVDLVPIKPIPRVVTFASDITTTQCRNQLRAEMKDWKADVVLHDGAPNVGTAWIQDAYSQSELVLMSLKLAVEFLRKDGTFITKVFRSTDYNSLIWVFSQLFGKVEATKPPSSRNVSAEIFVVCREFKAPKTIDPKFLDPKHVFKELTAAASSSKNALAANAQLNVFQPEKKRRQREGYEDGDYTLYKETGITDFIHAQDPIMTLGTVNRFTFKEDEEKEWLTMDATTPEIKSCCDDLKVLGKGDFKALLKWRIALREEIGLDVKSKETQELTETVEITEEVDEDQQIQDELERLGAEATSRAKRERRKANEKRTKTIQRMQLQMTAPVDIGMELQDQSLAFGQDDIFDLETAEQSGGKLRTVMDDDAASDSDGENRSRPKLARGAVESDDERNDLEAELDGMYDAYREQLAERDAKYRAKEARKKTKDREETWGGISQSKGSDADSDSDAGAGSNSDEEMSEEGGWDVVQRNKRRLDDDSGSSDSDLDSDDETDRRPIKKQRRDAAGSAVSTKKRGGKLLTKLDANPVPSSSRAAQMWFSNDVFAGVDDELAVLEDIDDVEMSDGGGQEDDVSMRDSNDAASNLGDSDIEIVPQDIVSDDDDDEWDVDDEDQDEIKNEKIRRHGLTTAEAVTLAQQLVNRQSTRTQLVNDGFSRYSLNAKDDLPSWFLDDESKHYKTNIPVTKEAIAALRAKQRALDARPIKKIAEAKARKKMRAARQIERAMKKAEGINETTELSEKAKAAQISKVVNKGLGKGKKKRETKLVVAKGPNRGLQGRPKGVRGHYKMVDSRMRKELRAQKRKAKAEKRR
ncbi:FtsJ-domain-containing protein [Auriculariales sp. MPI-PUGE-AT-0066]|nr:FtsJ-domain-containing protein [Auriculariales sp. MPI-PUGE-AT-0066]